MNRESEKRSPPLSLSFRLLRHEVVSQLIYRCIILPLDHSHLSLPPSPFPPSSPSSPPPPPVPPTIPPLPHSKFDIALQQAFFMNGGVFIKLTNLLSSSSRPRGEGGEGGKEGDKLSGESEGDQSRMVEDEEREETEKVPSPFSLLVALFFLPPSLPLTLSFPPSTPFPFSFS